MAWEQRFKGRGGAGVGGKMTWPGRTLHNEWQLRMGRQMGRGGICSDAFCSPPLPHLTAPLGKATCVSVPGLLPLSASPSRCAGLRCTPCSGTCCLIEQISARPVSHGGVPVISRPLSLPRGAGNGGIRGGEEAH